MSATHTVPKVIKVHCLKQELNLAFLIPSFIPVFAHCLTVTQACLTLAHSFTQICLTPCTHHTNMSYSCTQLHTKRIRQTCSTLHTASHGHVTFEFDAVGGLELASILVRGYPSGHILQELQQSTAMLPFTVCSVTLLTKSITEAGKVCFCLNVTVMNTKSSLPISLF